MKASFPLKRLLVCIATAVVFSTACSAGLRNGQLLSQVNSPDGSKVAYLVRSGGSLGPWDDFNFNVIVRAQNDQYLLKQGVRGTVWIAQSSQPVNLLWLSNSELAVIVDPGQGHMESMSMKSRPDVSVSTRKHFPDPAGNFPIVEVEPAKDREGW